MATKAIVIIIISDFIFLGLLTRTIIQNDKIRLNIADIDWVKKRFTVNKIIINTLNFEKNAVCFCEDLILQVNGKIMVKNPAKVFGENLREYRG